jgi:hypothetical protein
MEVGFSAVTSAQATSVLLTFTQGRILISKIFKVEAFALTSIFI